MPCTLSLWAFLIFTPAYNQLKLALFFPAPNSLLKQHQAQASSTQKSSYSSSQCIRTLTSLKSRRATPPLCCLARLIYYDLSYCNAITLLFRRSSGDLSLPRQLRCCSGEHLAISTCRGNYDVVQASIWRSQPAEAIARWLAGDLGYFVDLVILALPLLLCG